jgi:hypothetical protein
MATVMIAEHPMAQPGFSMMLLTVLIDKVTGSCEWERAT